MNSQNVSECSALTSHQTANRTLEDIDRFFETGPGIIVCRNDLATQLTRPQMYIDQDERIAQNAEKHEDWNGDVEKAQEDVNVERVSH